MLRLFSGDILFVNVHNRMTDLYGLRLRRQRLNAMKRFSAKNALRLIPKYVEMVHVGC